MRARGFYWLILSKLYQFKAKDLEIKRYPLCVENISGDFSFKNSKKAGLKGCVYVFFVDFRTFDTSNIIYIHQCLKKKQDR